MTVKSYAMDGSRSFYVAVNVNGNENITKYCFSFPEAKEYAKEHILNNPRHLKSYRVEVVENFGDRSRFAIYDKLWDEQPG